MKFTRFLLGICCAAAVISSCSKAEKVSKEAIDRFYEMVKPPNGNRWYDQDPVISKTVELLRVVPPDVQKACAEHFIEALKELGIQYESPNVKK